MKEVRAMLRNKSVVLLAVVLAFALVGMVQSANAQVLFGSASGTITDQSGAAVPKAHVSSVNKATGVRKETDADAGGFYRLTDLSPGLYDITVTAGGFKPLTQTSVNVTPNTVTNTNFNLQVGSVSEQVTGEAEGVTLQTEKTDVHTEIPSKAILEMPLNQYRNYQTLINLVPGATPGKFQNAIADSPERELTTNVNGTNRNNNNTRVDGAADVFVGLPHHTVYVPPAETIQEVNVATNDFDHEQGMTGGAAIPIDPIAAKIIADIPLPNVPGAGDINNYFFSATQRLNRNNIDAKVDWNRTTNHPIFVKYSTMKSVFHGVPSLGKAIGDCACDGGLGDFHSHVQLVTVGHTLTLSPTLVVDGNIGFTRMSEYGKTPDYGTNIGSDVLGLPGTNNGSDLPSSGFPFFAVSGFADIGNPEGWNPAFRNDWSFTTSHNVRWSKD